MDLDPDDLGKLDLGLGSAQKSGMGRQHCSKLANPKMHCSSILLNIILPLHE
jgi:hypothetical protein